MRELKRNNQKKSRFRKLKRETLIYLAGFLDGDGSILAQIIYRKDYVNSFGIRLSVNFHQDKRKGWFLR